MLFCMRFPQDPGRERELVLLMFLFALFIFASPFTQWWLGGRVLWFLPYLFWLCIIGLAAWIQLRRN